MLRTRRRKVYGVGPRSAHIAGLAVRVLQRPGRARGRDGGRGRAARAGDPADYLVVVSRPRVSTSRSTNTCAANRLGIVEPGDYAEGSAEAAAPRRSTPPGAYLRLDGARGRAPDARSVRAGRRSARRGGRARARARARRRSSRSVAARVVSAATSPARLGVSSAWCRPDAEVISSIGDALSLVRAARSGRSSIRPPPTSTSSVAEVEEEAMRVGAGPASLDVRVEYVADRHTLRAVATGSVGLESGARPGRAPASAEVIAARAADLGGEAPTRVGGFWVVAARLARRGVRPVRRCDHRHAGRGHRRRARVRRRTAPTWRPRSIGTRAISDRSRSPRRCGWSAACG